jgi:hypothetical protein
MFSPMEQDKLLWLWDGVNDIQTRFNAILTKVMQKYELPFDVAQYDQRIINSDYYVLKERSSMTLVPCKSTSKRRDFTGG